MGNSPLHWIALPILVSLLFLGGFPSSPDGYAWETEVVGMSQRVALAIGLLALGAAALLSRLPGEGDEAH